MLRDEILFSFRSRLYSNIRKTLLISLPSSPPCLQDGTGPVNGEFVANEALKYSGATSSRPFFHYQGYGSLY